MLKNLNRRSFIAWCSSAAAALGASRAAAAVTTPSATEGPYYPQPSMRFADVDNDLVKIIGMVREAGGEVVTLRGRVLNGAGRPLPAGVYLLRLSAEGQAFTRKLVLLR